MNVFAHRKELPGQNCPAVPERAPDVFFGGSDAQPELVENPASGSELSVEAA